MNLEKLKETWQHTDIKSDADDNKIYNILSRKGNTSLQKLIRYEKVGAYAMPFFTLLPFIHNWLVPNASYPIYSIILYIGFCVVTFFWQLFKTSFLKKIDIGRMDILSASRFIVRYKKFIQYELFGGLCWGVLFLGSYVVSLTYKFSMSNVCLFLILCVIIMLVVMIIISLFYFFFYIKHIRKIQDAINEIKEFEDQQD